MKRASILCIAIAALSAPAVAQHAQDAERVFEVQSGLVTVNDGTFNYQGFLEVDGQAANGMYSFRFEAFDDPNGFDIAHELYFTSELVQVVDGLFDLDVQMGGTPSEARRFWREIGNQEMYFEIGVSEVEGGPYTTLGTLSKLGWSARAQYAGIAESLRFPYIETYTNPDGTPITMISLTSFFGGTVLEMNAVRDTEEPNLVLHGPSTYGIDFGTDNGAMRVDTDEPVGITSFARDFAIAGFLFDETTSNGAAVIAQVRSPAGPGNSALYAYNWHNNNDVFLATDDHAAVFGGDVFAEGNLRVSGEPVRDFAADAPSPIGPIAYGFVSSNGATSGATANMSSVWDAPNERYVISVDNENITLGPYTSVVTVVDSFEPRVATTNTVLGNLIVRIWDLNSGNIAVQDNFQVVIYKANPNAFLRSGAPGGVDADKYYEQTGSSPVLGGVTTEPEPSPQVKELTERE